MARTYLEKFYFPLHATFIEGNLYGRELTDEEIIDRLPYIQNQIDTIQQTGKPQKEMAEQLNRVIGIKKLISATWGVTHRYGVPYGIVRVRCAAPVDAFERNEIRLIIGFINEDGFWSEFKNKNFEYGDKIYEVRMFDDEDGDYYVHTQSLMYIKWKRKKNTKKWRDK